MAGLLKLGLTQNLTKPLGQHSVQLAYRLSKVRVKTKLAKLLGQQSNRMENKKIKNYDLGVM